MIGLERASKENELVKYSRCSMEMKFVVPNPPCLRNGGSAKLDPHFLFAVSGLEPSVPFGNAAAKRFMDGGQLILLVALTLALVRQHISKET